MHDYLNKKIIGDDKMISDGQFAIVGIISHIIFIYIAWKMMLGINFEPIVRKNRVTEAQVIIIFIAIIIGSGVSRFVLDVIRWSQDIFTLF